MNSRVEIDFFSQLEDLIECAKRRGVHPLSVSMLSRLLSDWKEGVWENDTPIKKLTWIQGLDNQFFGDPSLAYVYIESLPGRDGKVFRSFTDILQKLHVELRRCVSQELSSEVIHTSPKSDKQTTSVLTLEESGLFSLVKQIGVPLGLPLDFISGLVFLDNAFSTMQWTKLSSQEKLIRLSLFDTDRARDSFQKFSEGNQFLKAINILKTRLELV